MTPILTGIIASGISGHLTPPWSPEGAYDALATVTVGSGGASSITFTGIPSTYKHLQIRGISFNVSDYWTRHTISFNSDTTNGNYSDHALQAYVSGSPSVVSYAETSTRKGVGGSGSSTYPAINIIDILDYSSVDKYKVSKTLVGTDNNALSTGIVGLMSNLWRSKSPITSITIANENSSNFSQHTNFQLYGVK